MLANLITSIVLSFGFGVSSLHDHNIKTIRNDDSPQYAINDYVLNQSYCFDYDFENDYVFVDINRLEPQHYVFEFITGNNGYIVGDDGQTIGRDSNIMFYPSYSYINYYDGIRFDFSNTFSPTTQHSSYKLVISLRSTSSGVSTWTTYPNFDDKYVIVNNSYLSSSYFLDINGDFYNFDFDYTNDLPKFINSTTILGSYSDSPNYVFANIIQKSGIYQFDTNFNPWFSIMNQDGNFTHFGRPITIGSFWNLNRLSVGYGNYFYNQQTGNNSPKLYQIDVFQGLFYFGGDFYTNIVLYFTSYWHSASVVDDVIEGCEVQFVYGQFVNYDTQHYFTFLSTNGYERDSQNSSLTIFDGKLYSRYNPSLTPFENYNLYQYNLSNLNNVKYLDITYSQLSFLNGLPSIQILFTSGRRQNSLGFRSGDSYNQLLGYNPISSGSIGGGGSTNDGGSTGDNLNDTFSLISFAFGAFGGLFDINILPGLAIGTFIFIPLIFVVLFAIIKLFKR